VVETAEGSGGGSLPSSASGDGTSAIRLDQQKSLVLAGCSFGNAVLCCGLNRDDEDACPTALHLCPAIEKATHVEEIDASAARQSTKNVLLWKVLLIIIEVATGLYV